MRSWPMDRNKKLGVTKAVSQDVVDSSKNALDQASAQTGDIFRLLSRAKGGSARPDPDAAL